MHTNGPWEATKEPDPHQYFKTPFYIRAGKHLIAVGGLQAEETMANAHLIAEAPTMLDEIDALANIVALNSHGESCYAEYWWDSSCDCGLMDLVLQLSPNLQNKLKAIRKAKDE